MKNYSLKYKFLGLIIFLFLSSFIAFFYIVYDFQKQKLKILKDEQILKIDNSFNKNIEKHLKNYCPAYIKGRVLVVEITTYKKKRSYILP